MPSRAVWAPHAVTSTSVSPDRTTTAPSACFASRPVSIDSDCRPKEILRVCINWLSVSSALRRPEGSDVMRGDAGPRRARLLPDAEPLDQLPVPVGILPFQVVEQPAPLADELQQPAA